MHWETPRFKMAVSASRFIGRFNDGIIKWRWRHAALMIFSIHFTLFYTRDQCLAYLGGFIFSRVWKRVWTLQRSCSFFYNGHCISGPIKVIFSSPRSRLKFRKKKDSFFTVSLLVPNEKKNDSANRKTKQMKNWCAECWGKIIGHCSQWRGIFLFFYFLKKIFRRY